MQSNLSVKKLTKALSKILHRYHVLLFALSAVGCLMSATYYLNTVLESSSASTDTTPYVGFDKSTIEKVNNLKTSQEQQAQKVDTLSFGRRNPFVE